MFFSWLSQYITRIHQTRHHQEQGWTETLDVALVFSCSPKERLTNHGNPTIQGTSNHGKIIAQYM